MNTLSDAHILFFLPSFAAGRRRQGEFLQNWVSASSYFCQFSNCNPLASGVPLQAMSEKLVTCRCQHCDCHIQFDAGGFQEGDTATVKCPDCQMDTEIFIPQSTPPPPAKTVTPKPDAKTSKTTSFLETLMLPQPPGSKPDAKPSKTTSETVSTGNFWMQAFSIILFLCGALSICIGALIWFGLLASKEGTIFQEYEGILFGLGGLIIIALSLILWAILSLKK